MSDLDNPIDSPGDWQREHIERYVATDGADGHEWQGVYTLLLTTRGRKSGKARRTPLIIQSERSALTGQPLLNRQGTNAALFETRR